MSALLPQAELRGAMLELGAHVGYSRFQIRMNSLFCVASLHLGILTACTTLPLKESATSKTNRVLDGTSHKFRVESSKDGEETHYWIVDSVDGHSSRLALPSLPHIETSTCPGPEFSVSPDGDWIVADEKLYHQANEVWLLHRESPLNYTLVFPSFSRAAWSYYEKASGRSFLLDNCYITRVSDWPIRGSLVQKLALTGGPEQTPVNVPNDHSLVISLYGDDQKTSVKLWFCYYDLEKHQFYLDAELLKHNENCVSPSKDR